VSLVLKVARRFYASYFSIGDVILYGKYKNHRGKVVSFSQDHWGNPTIEIEPIPKGRKQNKVMGLFKIWRADVKENAMKALQEGNKMAANMSKRVVARYTKKANIPLGKTFEIGSARVHRFADFFKIWDLTNAGKRGKKVRVMSVSPTHRYPGNKEEWLENMSKVLMDYKTYDKMLSLFKDLLVDFPGEIEINQNELRGIDVTPAGAPTKISITSPTLRIEAELTDFTVISTVEFEGRKNEDGQVNKFKQDTAYHSRDKKTAPLFYNWLKANLSVAAKMDISQMQKIWNELGVKYDYH